MDPTVSPVLVVAFGGYVYGLDPTSGHIHWEYQDGMRSPRLVVTGTHVFVQGQKLACLTYPQGQLVWQIDEPALESTLLVVGDRLFVGAAGEVSCLSAYDGTRLWKNEFKGRGQGPVALGTPFGSAQIDLTR